MLMYRPAPSGRSTPPAKFLYRRRLRPLSCPSFRSLFRKSFFSMSFNQLSKQEAPAQYPATGVSTRLDIFALLTIARSNSQHTLRRPINHSTILTPPAAESVHQELILSRVSNIHSHPFTLLISHGTIHHHHKISQSIISHRIYAP